MILKRRKPQKMGLREAPQIRSEKHKQWVRGHECAIAGRNGHVCSGKIEAAHVRTGTDGGLNVKPGDNWTIPLCGEAHIRTQHRLGERLFEVTYGINMKAIAEQLWKASPHGKKYRMENGL